VAAGKEFEAKADEHPNGVFALGSPSHVENGASIASLEPNGGNLEGGENGGLVGLFGLQLPEENFAGLARQDELCRGV